MLQATGVLKGTLTNANGNSLGTVSKTVTDSVNTSAAANAVAGCQILNLVLGPLNLNLLGLVVTLNQVHLNITAVPGAGNLLGNLLCAVANLLKRHRRPDLAVGAAQPDSGRARPVVSLPDDVWLRPGRWAAARFR